MCLYVIDQLQNDDHIDAKSYDGVRVFAKAKSKGKKRYQLIFPVQVSQS